MSNWLQSYAKNCCDELASVATCLQAREDALLKANDNYYQAAQKALDVTNYQGAAAFVSAVNTDVNRSKHKIVMLGHVYSAAKLLQAAITKSSQSHDATLVALAQDHESKVWCDQLVTETLRNVETQPLDKNILRAGGACIADAWGSAVQIVGKQEAEQDFHDLAISVKSQLQSWADEMNSEYLVFQKTLQHADYLSARDLFYYIANAIDETQNTDKPITITPYTTKDGKKGLLITMGGTDIFHIWDDGLFNALLTGVGGPDNPYMSALGDAIQQYMDEHPEMKGVDVTFVGSSLGGMIAQNWASLLHSDTETDLSSYDLNVTHVITYGSPVMGPRVQGIQYAMYNAVYDPIPLLSSYENLHITPEIKKRTEDLAASPVNVIPHFWDFARDLPELWQLYTSIVKADQEGWEEKRDSYIDSRHEYLGQIFSLKDVGNVSTYIPVLGHVLNLSNHWQYAVSDELNALKTAETLPNIDLESWGPTEYFGTYAPVALGK